MKRSGFARRPQYERKPVLVVPIPHDVAERISYTSPRLSVAVPKYAYVRDTRLRDMCRAMACQWCGRSGDHAGVTWAHSNQGHHGKGKGIKASDQFIAALCQACHSLLDQGGLKEAEAVAMWETAHERTLWLGLRNGDWPADIQMPRLVLEPCGAFEADGSRMLWPEMLPAWPGDDL